MKLYIPKEDKKVKKHKRNTENYVLSTVLFPVASIGATVVYLAKSYQSL